MFLLLLLNDVKESSDVALTNEHFCSYQHRSVFTTYLLYLGT